MGSTVRHRARRMSISNAGRRGRTHRTGQPFSTVKAQRIGRQQTRRVRLRPGPLPSARVPDLRSRLEFPVRQEAANPPFFRATGFERKEPPQAYGTGVLHFPGQGKDRPTMPFPCGPGGAPHVSLRSLSLRCPSMRAGVLITNLALLLAVPPPAGRGATRAVEGIRQRFSAGRDRGKVPGRAPLHLAACRAERANVSEATRSPFPAAGGRERAAVMTDFGENSVRARFRCKRPVAGAALRDGIRALSRRCGMRGQLHGKAGTALRGPAPGRDDSCTTLRVP